MYIFRYSIPKTLPVPGPSQSYLIQLEGTGLAPQIVEEPVSLLQPRELVVNETPVGAADQAVVRLRRLLGQPGVEVDILHAVVQLLQASDATFRHEWPQILLFHNIIFTKSYLL